MIDIDDEIHTTFGFNWDERSRCEACEIVINDCGQLQCRECWALHNAKSTQEQLSHKYDDLEPKAAAKAIEDGWRQLMKVRALYRQGHTEKLKRIYNGFRNEDCKSNSRDYYELKN